MGEPAQIYMLKDLARLSGHSIYTLKFYLKIGLVQEVGRSPETRFRYFDDSTLARLALIRAHRKEGKGLTEIRTLLSRTDPTSGLAPPSTRPPGHSATGPLAHPATGPLP